MKEPSHRLPAILLTVFAAIWLGLAIAPRDRADFWLESVLVLILVPLLAWGYRRLRFSNPAYVCLFVFFVLHAIGAHYTYSEVPYDAFFRGLAGFSLDQALGFERNQYDRLIHFLYGALILPASIELFADQAPPRGWWRILMPFFFVSSHAVFYELIEWAAAEVFGGDLGQAYLGTQGDDWDAQKDMGLAVLGTLLAIALLEIGRFTRGRPKRV